MKALIVIACGVFAGACASNEEARKPARSSGDEWTTVVTRVADAPDRAVAPDYGGSSAPSDAPGAPRAESIARPRIGEPGRSQLSAIRDPAPSGLPATGAGGDAPPIVAQGSSDLDVMVTQQLEKALRLDPSLSSAAKSVTISTQAGEVTLQGVVKSQRERQSIVDSARKIAGAGKVDDQLDVKEPEGK